MSQLFAALNVQGEIRFVGDVDRGAACGCFCPDCSSPLVAKQGSANEWHFAHEGGQERPECLVGAQNLLRRFCMEHLQHRALSQSLTLPPGRSHAELTTLYFSGHEPIEVVDQFEGTVRWHSRPPKDGVAGNARLASGVEVVVLIHTHVGRPVHPADVGQAVASVAFVLPPPDTLVRRDAVSLSRHIEAHGRFVWLHHPALKDVHAAAMARLQQKADAAKQETLARQNHQASLAAGQRWGQTAQRMRSQQEEMAMEAQRQGMAAPPLPAAPSFPNAPGHAANASFQFFELKSGDAWVLYPVDPEFAKASCPADVSFGAVAGAKLYAVAPYPAAFDGWDESLPPSVGKVDPHRGIYWLIQPLNAAMFLSPRSSRTASSRDWSDFSSEK